MIILCEVVLVRLADRANAMNVAMLKRDEWLATVTLVPRQSALV